jgi:hypothetical protein
MTTTHHEMRHHMTDKQGDNMKQRMLRIVVPLLAGVIALGTASVAALPLVLTASPTPARPTRLPTKDRCRVEMPSSA